VIQINSSSCAKLPTETHEILDRRNALSGNLSMEQELGFIESINRKITQGIIDREKFRHVRVMRIALDRELGYNSKLDRRPEWLNELREYGRTKCRWFLREREAQLQGSLMQPAAASSPD
jgi:NTE family protein